MAHMVTKLSEAQLIAEIQRIQGETKFKGGVSHQNALKGQAPIGNMEIPTSQGTGPFSRAEPAFEPSRAPLSAVIQPKRRGRPKGSRNRPKEIK